MNKKLFARVLAIAGSVVVAGAPFAGAEEDSHGLLQGAIKDTGVGKWLDETRIGISGHAQAGVTGNFDDPTSRINFGRLFDDRANDFALNQVLLTIERPLAPEEGKWDWGFKIQPMYGSDARYTHLVYLLDNYSNDYFQFDLVEAYANVHLPYLTKGGIDVKGGIFVTLQGLEVIYGPGNPFYSHSYLFNYAIPLKHTGGLVTLHLTDQIDLHAGGVTGINTFTDNNDSPSLHLGASWASKNEKATVFAAFHYGPENDSAYSKPALGGVDSNSDARYIADVVLTLKPTDKLTLMTDLNYGKEDGFQAEWYGVAQYMLYQALDWLRVGVRGEVFRDDDGFAVVQFNDNDDFLDALRGRSVSPKTVSGGDTTYYELTAGVAIEPCKHVMLRPEVRWDWSSGGNKPFNDMKDGQMWTLAMDVIIKF
jgi:hypothetical protein